MYAKLFTSIYQGTLRGNSHGLLVFTNLLAHADREGYADIHPRAIAEEVGLSVEEVKAAIEVLESPDDESRSPEEQGRRIVRIDDHRAWGWKVVNYVKYRGIRDEEDRREQNRKSQAKWRAKQADSNQRKPASAKESRSSVESAHTEAEAEVDTEAKAKQELLPTAGASAPKSADPIWHTGLSFLERKGIPKDQARKFLGKLKREAGDIQAAALLAEAESQDITDPIPWLSKGAISAKKGKPSVAASFSTTKYEGTPDDQLPSFMR